MVVDDEVYIADGLCDYLQKNMPYNIDVIKAYSGIEALEHISKTRIDIVIIDINMPGMDGFSLSNNIALHWPACKFIFLTGYEKFDYAYRAMKYKHAYFLLKSEGYGALQKVIDTIIQEIDRENNETIHIPNDNLPEDTKEAITSFLDGQESDSDLSNHSFSNIIKPTPYLCVVAMLDNCELFTFSQKRKLKTIESYSRNFFKLLVSAHSLLFRNKFIVWLILPSKTDEFPEKIPWTRIIQFTKGMTEALQTVCMECLDLRVSFAVSTQPVDWIDLPQCVDVLIYMLTNELTKKNKDVQFITYDCPAYITTSDKNLRTLLHKLQRYLFTNKRYEFFNAFNMLSDKIINNKISINEEQNIMSFIKHITELYINFTRLPADGYIAMLNSIECFSYEPLKIMFDSLFSQKEKYNENTEIYNLIESVNSYINDHISQNITLSEIAQHVYINPSYLSRIYKKLSGMNLFDYISWARIEKAKSLLSDDNSCIADIAVSVGFNSISYFSSVFKKKVGVSPMEYKKRELSL